MDNKHISMLLDYSELNNLFTESFNLDVFFQKIVDLVAKHMKADNCSIFLYDNISDVLFCKASTDKNLMKDIIISLKEGNDYISLSLKNYQPIIINLENNGNDSRLLKDIKSYQFKSFIAMPIFRGTIKFGVFVIQSKMLNFFTNKDILALQIISSQLAFLIESAKTFSTLSKSKGRTKKAQHKKIEIEKNTHFHGETASKGVVYGGGIVYENVYNIETIGDLTKDINFTLADFNTALTSTAEQLIKAQKKIETKLADASSLIFAAHLLILKDDSFLNEIYKRIRDGEHIANALTKVFYKYKDIFLRMTDPLIKEKLQDLEDLIIRLFTNLVNLKVKDTIIDIKGKIVVAKKLLPSDIFKMSVENVKGIILINSGITAHVSILARSLRIPLVVVNNRVLLTLPDKAKILLDANSGDIYYEPNMDFVKQRIVEALETEKTLTSDKIVKYKTKTKDGKIIKLSANINLLSDLKNMNNIENDGVGLFRTEFPFIIRKNLPTEEEQYVNYKKLFDLMKDKEVTIRTLDIGGDKILAYYQMEKENNPSLGLRSIRFSLKHLDIFKAQIRAILRAGFRAKLKIMFPLIYSLDEFLEAKKIVNDCIFELKNERLDCNDSPKIGLMVEVPSVVDMIEDFAKNADFFSIGTNDLIQYTLAIDRTNATVSELYIPHHPSILKSIKQIADAANKYKIEASLCGDMANNRNYIPFLIGVGITSLSVDTIYLPKVKKIISELTINYCIDFADKLLSLSKISDIESLLPSLH